MEHKAASFVLLAILGLITFSPISKIYVDEPISAGNENGIYVVVNNDLKKDLEGSKVRIFIEELGIVLYSNEFDLKSRSNMVARFNWEPEDIPSGNYLARVEFSNDKVRSWKYVYLPLI